MKVRLPAFALASAMLAACVGAGPPFPAGLPAGGYNQATSRTGRSWALPEARRDDLLYVSSAYRGVQIYSYPRGKLVGQLSDIAWGMCTDAAGNVYLTELGYSNSFVKVYAHGGTKPIRTLDDGPEIPFGCAIDGKSGNLAVTNIYANNRSTGNLSIFTHAKNGPTTYSLAGMDNYYLCSYDGSGNLYFDGIGASRFEMGELPYLQQTTRTVKLNVTPQWAGGVEWDGHYMAVGGAGGPIYRYSLNGARGRKIGSLTLRGIKGAQQFWIHAGAIIAPDLGQKKTAAWPYPRGGWPSHVFSKTGGNGVVISQAP